MTSHLLMLIITILTLIFIAYCFIFSKWVIGAIIAVFIQSMFLFNIRYFWEGENFNFAFLHSFYFLTIIVIIIFIVYKIKKDNSIK